MNITNWKSPTGQLLRQLATEEGEPLFVAKDVCEALGIKDVSMATASLDADERGTSIVGTPGGPQQVTVVTEPGLYRLIMKSRKEEAVTFRRWVTHEVLPTIRKTGAYQAHPDAPPTWLMPMLAAFQQTVITTVTAIIEAKLADRFTVEIPVSDMATFKRRLAHSASQAVSMGMYASLPKARYAIDSRVRRAAGWPRSAGARMERMPLSAWPHANIELSEIEAELKRFNGAQLKLILNEEAVARGA